MMRAGRDYGVRMLRAGDPRRDFLTRIVSVTRPDGTIVNFVELDKEVKPIRSVNQDKPVLHLK